MRYLMHLVSDLFDDNTAWIHAIRNHCYYGFAHLHVYYPLWPIYQVRGWNIFYPGRGEDIYDNFSNDYNSLFSKAFH